MSGDSEKSLYSLDSDKGVVEIDGSSGEGGGEILRNSVAYSAVLNKPIKVVNIRAGRPKPGLRPQHLQGIILTKDLCSAKVENCCENSTQITFKPNFIKGGKFLADTKTAGSVTLLLQSVLPCMLFANSDCCVVLKGGTNADFAPQIDFVSLVLKPILERFSVVFDLRVVMRGYYPKGGGEIVVNTKPVQFLPNFEMVDRGEIVSIYGRCFVAGVLPIKIAHEMKQLVLKSLRSSQFSRSFSFDQISINIEAVKEKDAFGNGSGLQLVAKSSTGCLFSGAALGNRNMTTSQVVDNAISDLADSLVRNSKCCVDKYIQDQLIIFMALAKGSSRIRTGALSSHTKTAIDVAEKMTGVKFEVGKHADDGEENDLIISCTGIGFTNPVLNVSN